MEQEFVQRAAEVIAAAVFGAGAVVGAVQKKVATALIAGGLGLLALAAAVKG